MSQGIYRITNLINGKEYIGQSVNIEHRWHNHISNSKSKTKKVYKFPLYASFRKYGLENFKFEILELVPNKSILLKKEQYYYELSNHAYNQEYPQIAGESIRKSVYQIDMNTLKVIKEFNSSTQAQKTLSSKFNAGVNIREVCNKNRYSSNGYFWCYKKDYTKDWKPIENNCTKTILQYSLDGEFMNEYRSVMEAAKQNNISQHSIRYYLKGNFKNYTHYIWKYKGVAV